MNNLAQASGQFHTTRTTVTHLGQVVWKEEVQIEQFKSDKL